MENLVGGQIGSNGVSRGDTFNDRMVNNSSQITARDAFKGVSRKICSKKRVCRPSRTVNKIQVFYIGKPK